MSILCSLFVRAWFVIFVILGNICFGVCLMYTVFAPLGFWTFSLAVVPHWMATFLLCTFAAFTLVEIHPESFDDELVSTCKRLEVNCHRNIRRMFSRVNASDR